MDSTQETSSKPTDATECSGNPACLIQEKSTPATEIQEKSTPVEFVGLPEGIWLHIISFLPLSDRYNMTVSCDLFRQLFFHPVLWRSVELSCFLAGSGRDSVLVLRPSHKQIAVQFGHLFHSVVLHVQRVHSPVEEETARIVRAVAERSSLKGLKLVADSSRCDRQGDTPVCASRLAMDMVKKATALQYLDVSCWPVFYSSFHDDPLNVLNVLLLPDTCPRLQSLDIACKIVYDVDSLERFRQTVVRLVLKFVHLRHLRVRQIHLSDLLLHELASPCRDRLQTLSLLTREPEHGEDDGEREGPSTAHIPHTSWSTLRSSCPGLELHVQAEVAHVPSIRWALSAHMPVVAVELLYCSLPADLLSCLRHLHGSLRSLTCHVMPGHSNDLPLLQVASACTRLRNLVFFGKVRSDTVLRLAALPRQWRTFRFRLKHVVMVRDRAGEGAGCCGGDVVHGEAEKRQAVRELCAAVSRQLGYPWELCKP
ncbi:uncharacterized protein LOC143300537 [Babylonia areolata]|uniref:uncharacterized protein LOC143300537 n=1 Tax=Babylonia areolata TaxID=304850 RepID=UPI003FD0A52F